jgi:7-cyano-7-deazaguanosine (preQ0) biosynthesis protein QueE
VDRSGLTVSEVFGPTIQGEGPSAGRRAGFIRLGRCNLACSFCDTPYTWDWTRFDPVQELRRVPVGDLLESVRAMDVPLLVITGGEPLLQQRRLLPLLEAVHRLGIEVEVETAGTIAPKVPDGLVTRWNVSPKLASSGNSLAARYRPEVLAAFQATGRAIFKFVVTAAADLEEIESMVSLSNLEPVWLMPEGTDATAVVNGMRVLASEATSRGWHLSPRLHILIWGDRRGV